MAVTHEDVTELKKVFDDRYVMIEDCNEKQAKINSKFANDDKRIELVISKVGTFEKLMWIIATATVGGLVTSILGLIFK